LIIKFVLGSRSSVVDNRRKWEDRVFVGQIERASGTKLIVGIVADGCRQRRYGSRGAQMPIDQTREYLKSGQAQNIPDLIKNAIEFANKSVYQENQVNNGDGLTTLVVASSITIDSMLAMSVTAAHYWVQSPTARTKMASVFNSPGIFLTTKSMVEIPTKIRLPLWLILSGTLRLFRWTLVSILKDQM
jgi:hypothetical protein